MKRTLLCCALLASGLPSLTACVQPSHASDSSIALEFTLRVLGPEGAPTKVVDVGRHHPVAWDVGREFGVAMPEEDGVRIRLTPGIDHSIPLSVASEFGAVKVPVPPAGTTVVTVRFDSPGTLDLDVSGTRGSLWQYFVFLTPVGDSPSDDYFEGTLDPEDGLTDLPFQPGEYDLEICRHSLGYDPIFERRVVVQPGANRVRVQLAESHDLTVVLQGSTEEEFVSAWSAEGLHVSADVEGEEKFEFYGLPPGKYALVLESGDDEEAMVVQVPMTGKVRFKPTRIDKLRVTIADYEPGHPLEEAGCRDGDLVVEIAGKRFHSWSGARNLIRETASSELVRVAVLRGEQRLTVSVLGATMKDQLRGYGALIPSVR